jgi:hypothetical protein
MMHRSPARGAVTHSEPGCQEIVEAVDSDGWRRKLKCDCPFTREEVDLNAAGPQVA